MPGLGDGPNLNDWRHVWAEAEQGNLQKLREQNELRAQARGVNDPRRTRLLVRLRRILGRAAMPPAIGADLSHPGLTQPELSQQQVWARELQRRREYERDRSDLERGHSDLS